MRVKKRTLLWIIWIIAWIVSMKVMAGLGMVYSRGIFSLLLEGILSCVAAYLMASSKLFKWVLLIYLVIQLIRNFNIVGIFCFIMSIILYFATKHYSIQNP